MALQRCCLTLSAPPQDREVQVTFDHQQLEALNTQEFKAHSRRGRWSAGTDGTSGPPGGGGKGQVGEKGRGRGSREWRRSS